MSIDTATMPPVRRTEIKAQSGSADRPRDHSSFASEFVALARNRFCIAGCNLERLCFPIGPCAALRSGDQNRIYPLPLRRKSRQAVEQAITRIETQSFAKEGQSSALDLRRLTQGAIKELRAEKAKRYQTFGEGELSELCPS